jgi:hypothetical protein
MFGQIPTGFCVSFYEDNIWLSLLKSIFWPKAQCEYGLEIGPMYDHGFVCNSGVCFGKVILIWVCLAIVINEFKSKAHLLEVCFIFYDSLSHI